MQVLVGCGAAVVHHDALELHVHDDEGCRARIEEFDADLPPERRFQYRAGVRGPRFDPARAPALDPGEWPPERLWKARRNFAVEYVESTIKALLAMYGMKHGSELTGWTFLLTGLQLVGELREALGIVAPGARGVAELMVGVGQARGDRMELAEAGGGAFVVRQRTCRLFRALDAPEATYLATDRVFEAAAEVLGPGIRIESTSLMRDAGGCFEWRVSG